MNEPNIELMWMPVFWSDLLAGTTHMDAAELGGFMLLIAEQWKRGHLPNDNRKLKKIARINCDLQLDTILEKFVTDPNGNLINKVCAQVRVEQIAKYVVNVERARKGGKAKALKQMAANNLLEAHLVRAEEEKKENRDTNVSLLLLQAGHEKFAEKIFSDEGELDKQNIELLVRRPLTRNDCNEFNALLAIDEKAHTTFSEWKKHFRNWLTTKPKTHEHPPARKQRTGANTTAIVSAADAVLQQYQHNQHTAGPAEPGQHTGFT
ncbi:MAG: hypothetical protein RLZZ367_2391 [Bacteroidota bacterium]